MISEHSAHSTPQPFGIRTWLWRHTCLLLISMLWHMQAIFESEGDKLSSSAEGRIRTHQGLRHQIASRLNARWQTDWAIEDQAKTLNSTARPYDQQAFSPPDPTAIWHSHLALAIYIFVIVNFDALAQASDFRIERRQVVFLCWEQDSNPGGLWNPIFSRLNACWQTDWAIEDQAIKLELDSPSLWSASIQPTRPHNRLAFAPGSGDIHVCCCLFRCSGTGKRYSNLGRHWLRYMAWCLAAPSHYLNQCWLMISEVLWHSPDSNFTENTQDICRWNGFEVYLFETVVKSARGQWVKSLRSVTHMSLWLGPSLVQIMPRHLIGTIPCQPGMNINETLDLSKKHFFQENAFENTVPYRTINWSTIDLRRIRTLFKKLQNQSVEIDTLLTEWID